MNAIDNTREEALRDELARKEKEIERLNEFIKTAADAVKKTLDSAKALIISQGEEIKALEEWAEAERYLRMHQSGVDPKRYNELARKVCIARGKAIHIRAGNKLRAHCEGKPVINNEDEISMPGMAED